MFSRNSTIWVSTTMTSFQLVILVFGFFLLPSVRVLGHSCHREDQFIKVQQSEWLRDKRIVCCVGRVEKCETVGVYCRYGCIIYSLTFRALALRHRNTGALNSLNLAINVVCDNSVEVAIFILNGFTVTNLCSLNGQE